MQRVGAALRHERILSGLNLSQDEEFFSFTCSCPGICNFTSLGGLKRHITAKHRHGSDELFVVISNKTTRATCRKQIDSDGNLVVGEPQDEPEQANQPEAAVEEPGSPLPSLKATLDAAWASMLESSTPSAAAEGAEKYSQSLDSHRAGNNLAVPFQPLKQPKRLFDIHNKKLQATPSEVALMEAMYDIPLAQTARVMHSVLHDKFDKKQVRFKTGKAMFQFAEKAMKKTLGLEVIKRERFSDAHDEAAGKLFHYWLDPLKVVKHMTSNPNLQGDKFMYGPSIPEHNGCSQLNQTVLWHKVQLEIGDKAMAVFIVTNVDDMNTTTRTKSKLFWIRLGNTKAPWCFEASQQQLISCFPLLKQKKGVSDEAFIREKLRVFHQCVEEMFKNFNNASHTGTFFPCPDGKDRFGYPLVCFHSCDLPEAQAATTTKANCCPQCGASACQFDCFGLSLEPKTRAGMKRKFAELVKDEDGADMLDETGRVKEGKLEALKRAEEHFLGSRLVRNGFDGMRFFDVYKQTVPECLHLIDLGLFPSLVFLFFGESRSHLFSQLPDHDGKAWEKAMDRLELRMSRHNIFLGQKFSKGVLKFAKRFSEKQEKGDEASSPLYKAYEFRLVMSAFPLFWANLFKLELAKVSANSRFGHFPDPQHPACAVTVAFLEYYSSLRRVPQFPSKCHDQFLQAQKLDDLLKTCYPGKNFSHTKKYHNALRHVASIAPCLGPSQLQSTDPFEMGNKQAKRVAQRQTNHRDMDPQILAVTLRKISAQSMRWRQKGRRDGDIPTLEEAQDEKRGGPAGLQDSRGVQFPLLSLLERKHDLPTDLSQSGKLKIVSNPAD
eukprot:3941000-Rhodomonas_salina.1